MPKTFVESGENLSALSARVFNGDWSRFEEILDLNPELDIFDALPASVEIKIPEVEQILNVAQPALSSVRSAIAGVSPSLARSVDDIEGYAKEAISLVGKINGTIQEAETIVNDALTEARSYKGKLVQLVPWLLSGKV